MRLMFACTLAFGSLTAFAEDDSKTVASSDTKAVNTVCPMDGKPVDPKLAPIAGKTAEGKMVMIGCCSDDCATLVKKSPNDFADDAVKNKKHDFNGKNNQFGK